MSRIRLNSPENIVARYPNSFGGEDVRKLDAHEQVHLPGVRPLFGTWFSSLRLWCPKPFDTLVQDQACDRMENAMRAFGLTFCKK